MTHFFTPEQTAAVTTLARDTEGVTWNTAAPDEKAYAWGGCNGCTFYNHNGDHNDEDTVMLTDATGDDFTCCPTCFEACSW